MGKRNHSKNHSNQCTVATGIIDVREIIRKGELIMEGLGLLREVTEWIPREVKSISSNRDIESHQIPRRWVLGGGMVKGRVILSKNHRKASVRPFLLGR